MVSWVALAAVAAATGAMAQATISGTVGFGLDKVGNDKQYGFQTTNINFTASEDLGGGLRATAAVRVETGTNANRGNVAKTPASGTITGVAANSNIYAADRSLGLAGGFGSLTMASTRSGNLAVSANVAPLSLNVDQYSEKHGVFTPVARGGITTISYVSPQIMPGLTANVAHVLSGTSAADQKATTNVIGVSYRNGPLTAGFANKKNNTAANTAAVTALNAYFGANTVAAADLKSSTNEVFATYNLGVATVGAGWSSKRFNADKAATTLGVSAPVASNITVGLNYGKRDKAKYQEIGANYALSKRTSLMFASAKYQDHDDATSTSQYRLRVQHSF